jgi:hypothetical protein
MGGLVILSAAAITWYILKHAWSIRKPVSLRFGAFALVGPASINITTASLGVGILVGGNDCSKRVESSGLLLLVVGLVGLLFDLTIDFWAEARQSPRTSPGTVSASIGLIYLLGASLAIDDISSCAAITAHLAIFLLFGVSLLSGYTLLEERTALERQPGETVPPSTVQ